MGEWVMAKVLNDPHSSVRCIHMLLPEKVLFLDMAAPLEVLRIARKFGANYDLCISAPNLQVTTSLALQVSQSETWPPVLKPWDLVIIPGFVLEENFEQRSDVIQIVQFLKDSIKPDQHEVMSICAGAFILAKAGLLNQKACTTHHGLQDKLAKMYPQSQVQKDRIFVEDQGVLTSAGITAGLDVTLYWLAQNYGSQIATQTAQEMNLYFRRAPNDPTLSPWLAGRNHFHKAIHCVQDKITQNPTMRFTLQALADEVHLSSRHLSRLFKLHTGLTLYEYQLSLKQAMFHQARQTGLSQEKAALHAGFSSASAWRKSANAKG